MRTFNKLNYKDMNEKYDYTHKGNAYDYYSKNHGRDLIYQTRLKLVKRLKINKHSNSKIHSYIMEAELGIILN